MHLHIEDGRLEVVVAVAGPKALGLIAQALHDAAQLKGGVFLVNGHVATLRKRLRATVEDVVVAHPAHLRTGVFTPNDKPLER